MVRRCGGGESKTFSDYRNVSFGVAYGVYIKELRVLARAVFVVGPAGLVQYTQLVKEIANEPDYDEGLRAVSRIDR
jgi:thiol peroxidase